MHDFFKFLRQYINPPPLERLSRRGLVLCLMSINASVPYTMQQGIGNDNASLNYIDMSHPLPPPGV
jgi:hypothetical protein